METECEWESAAGKERGRGGGERDREEDEDRSISVLKVTRWRYAARLFYVRELGSPCSCEERGNGPARSHGDFPSPRRIMNCSKPVKRHKGPGDLPIPEIQFVKGREKRPLSRTLRVFGICWPDPVAPNQQREEKSAAEQSLTDGFLRPAESVRATALTLRAKVAGQCPDMAFGQCKAQRGVEV
ncbi:unnamed protein product [Pleuronectes platessa]|uniref:Uncharacterized protein n=1 Tax=Pleuronectes platessa TaxID=8262 RepID=A0A9N7U2E9_PLEPL|nr:unnamed protein product [Pleuronectes platessa]